MKCYAVYDFVGDVRATEVWIVDDKGICLRGDVCSIWGLDDALRNGPHVDRAVYAS